MAKRKHAPWPTLKSLNIQVYSWQAISDTWFTIFMGMTPDEYGRWADDGGPV